MGNFKGAMELLKKQLAITNFQPMKEAFIDSFTLSKLKFATMPHLPASDYQMRMKGGVPLAVITLESLNTVFAKGLELTTQGKFAEALAEFR